eukprot:jgi/Mesvir1/10307/Mv23058-RA.1
MQSVLSYLGLRGRKEGVEEEGYSPCETDDAASSADSRRSSGGDTPPEPWWCKIEVTLLEIEDLMRRLDAVVTQNQQTLGGLTRDVARLKRHERRCEQTIRDAEGVMRVLENVFCT